MLIHPTTEHRPSAHGPRRARPSDPAELGTKVRSARPPETERTRGTPGLVLWVRWSICFQVPVGTDPPTAPHPPTPTASKARRTTEVRGWPGGCIRDDGLVDEMEGNLEKPSILDGRITQKSGPTSYQSSGQSKGFQVDLSSCCYSSPVE